MLPEHRARYAAAHARGAHRQRLGPGPRRGRARHLRPRHHVRELTRGKEVRDAVATTPDLVVLDLQIGNMGGMATCLDLRLEEAAAACRTCRS